MPFEGPVRKFTNADLPRFGERPRLGIQIERPPAPQEDAIMEPGENVDQMLAAAKASLARANNLTSDVNRESAAAVRDAELRPGVERENAEVPSVMDSMATRLGKQSMHYLKTRPEVIEKVAPYATMIGGPVGMAAEGVFAGSSARNLLDDKPDSGLDTAMNVLGLAGGGAALMGLKKLIGGSVAAAKTAEGARYANQVERDLVDSYAARELASGSRKTPQTILRRAHESAGRIHGEETLNKTQLHPDYPDLPASVTQGINERNQMREMYQQPFIPWEGGSTVTDALEGLRDRAMSRRMNGFNARVLKEPESLKGLRMGRRADDLVGVGK